MMQKKYHYKDKDGLIISAAQGRILERRKMAVQLYRRMLPKYATYSELYIDIAVKLTDEGYPCNFHTVYNDLKASGVLKTTPQTRKGKNDEENVELIKK